LADEISCFYPGLIMVGGVLRQALVSERKPYYVQSKNCWTLYFKLSAEIYKKLTLNDQQDIYALYMSLLHKLESDPIQNVCIVLTFKIF
jgi:hypothetical protein